MLFLILQLVNVQLFSKYDINVVRIKMSQKEIILKKENINRGVNISLDNNSFIEINKSIKRYYSGNVKIFKKNNKVIIVQNLKLHDYVIRVIASELGVNYNEELIRAFYLVVKSYTINNLRKHKKFNADLCDITHCQLYYGNNKNLDYLYAVTNDLKNSYLCYKNKIIEAYYSTVCGPYTISPEFIWKKKLPYLESKLNMYKGDILAANSKYYKWRAIFNKNKLLKLFSLEKLEIKKSFNTYVLTLGDDKKTINAQYFKRKIGHKYAWGKLKSLQFTIKEKGKNYIFEGYGSGNGVGFCLAEAKDLSDRKVSYLEIISFFFKDVKICKNL